MPGTEIIERMSMKEGKNLVIVESPGKIDKIRKALGSDYKVMASIGHIRDLDESGLSIDVANGFKPEYVVPAEKKKVVADLKKAAKDASAIWLASDADREGEAISWHLFETLGLSAENTRRIVFQEITKPAILNAIQNPREIDMNLVNAQQARRVLDRLVGFELSPVLWRKIQPKLSAGRVQSVALRLIVDREREILAFNNEAYYKVEAMFHPEGTPENTLVKATLDRRFPDMDSAREFLERCIGASFSVCDIEKKEGNRFPAAPFTTSTLQQEAARKLRFSVSQTMSIAQHLYENGYITYMRKTRPIFPLSPLTLPRASSAKTSERNIRKSETNGARSRGHRKPMRPSVRHISRTHQLKAHLRNRDFTSSSGNVQLHHRWQTRRSSAQT